MENLEIENFVISNSGTQGRIAGLRRGQQFIVAAMPSHIDWIRAFCLSLPHATEDIQWENNLLFRIAKKMFCIASLEPAAHVKFCFKCTPEKFAELVEIGGVIPAPYMARNHWVGIVELSALRQPDVKELVRNSYQLVFEKLPKKLQAELNKKKSFPSGTVRKRIR